MHKEMGTSFYYRVARTIRGRINSGQCPPGVIGPLSHKLSEEFGLSNIKIQKAMEILSLGGLYRPPAGRQHPCEETGQYAGRSSDLGKEFPGMA